MEREQRERILATILSIVAVAIIPFLLWGALSNYINPATATERKDVVNIFVLSAAGLVGSITALAAVGNLFFSGRNLQQQRELDDRRAQDDALQKYFEQMGDLLTSHGLVNTEDENELPRSLARAHTLTVLRRLEGPGRKTHVVLFLYRVGLIGRDTIVSLVEADLSGTSLTEVNLSEVNLNGAYLNDAFLENANLTNACLRRAFIARTNLSRVTLRGADLTEAILTEADLSGADLSGADLSSADLSEANLSDANLSGANLSNAFLRGAKVDNRQLERAQNLSGITLPDGTQYSLG